MKIELQDHSGTISPEELLGVLRAMGQNPTEDELLNLVLEVDIDGNGTIEFEEFLTMLVLRYLDRVNLEIFIFRMKKKASEADEEADLRLEIFRVLLRFTYWTPGRPLRYSTVTRTASSA